MNSSDPILVVDVNVIIHLEKVDLLDELTNDKNIRIVDLVLYQEYQYKKNKSSEKISNIISIIFVIPTFIIGFLLVFISKYNFSLLLLSCYLILYIISKKDIF